MAASVSSEKPPPDTDRVFSHVLRSSWIKLWKGSVLSVGKKGLGFMDFELPQGTPLWHSLLPKPFITSMKGCDANNTWRFMGTCK